ncbi:MAG: LytTR family transcriptional regulator [Bacteroidales bacterium]|nr:LytTR family transcriptional regulator [Bacteroidales bacterium]
MNKLSRYLNQPYPLFDGPWLIVAICSLCVFLILAVFEPFNFHMRSSIQILILAGFVLTVFTGSSLVFVLFPKIFKKFYIPENWTIGKNIIHFALFLSLLGILIVVYDMVILTGLLFGTDSINILSGELLVNLFATFTTGIIPVIIITFITKNKALKQNLAEATRLNEILTERVRKQIFEENKITLTGSTKDSVSILPESIYYIEVSGNYINIWSKNNNIVKHKKLRATIKQIEEQLQDYPFVIRCHRAFIVNIHMITKIKGNAQGYKLQLKEITKEIPVSRTYMENFKKAIE